MNLKNINKKWLIVGGVIVILIIAIMLITFSLKKKTTIDTTPAETTSTTTTSESSGELPKSTTEVPSGVVLPSDQSELPAGLDESVSESAGEELLRAQLPIMTEYFYMEYKPDAGRYLVTLYINPLDTDAGTVDEQLAYTQAQAEIWISNFIDPASLPIDYTDAR